MTKELNFKTCCELTQKIKDYKELITKPEHLKTWTSKGVYDGLEFTIKCLSLWTNGCEDCKVWIKEITKESQKEWESRNQEILK